VLGHLGLAEKMPTRPKSPGRDFSPLLAGKKVAWDNAVFYEFEICRAIRTDRWKLVLRQPAGPHELYDLAADPQERTNRFGEPGTAGTTTGLQSRLADFFRQYATPEYDIWTGGRSKASRATGK
jgi:arylsulfatase A-like enzyme